MRRLSIAVAAVMALAPLWAGQPRAGKVELKGVHMCCEGCAKACVEGVLKKVDGVSDVHCDHTAKTVTFTAKNEKVAAPAIKALYDSGSFGKGTVDGKEIKVEAPAPRTGAVAFHHWFMRLFWWFFPK